MPLSSDFSKFPLPLQPYINGEFVDSVGAEKHTLVSAVNDQVITKGIFYLSSSETPVLVTS
jgi:hypothetical protein